MELFVNGHSERECGMGQTTVQGRQIEFFVRGTDEVSLNVSKSKMEIKSKIALKNGNDLGDGDSVGPLNDILNALFISIDIELGGVCRFI